MSIRGFTSQRIGQNRAPIAKMETDVNIVGIESQESPRNHVHTIDMWFSDRRGVWVVERLNADGDRVGVAHACEREDDAVACVAEWLRAHTETQLVSPRKERRKVRRISRRAA